MISRPQCSLFTSEVGSRLKPDQAQVLQKVNNAIHWINHYPVLSMAVVVEKGLHFWCLPNQKDQKWDQHSHHALLGHDQAVQRVDYSIHRINHYPVDTVAWFVLLTLILGIAIHPVNTCSIIKPSKNRGLKPASSMSSYQFIFLHQLKFSMNRQRSIVYVVVNN